MPTHQPILGHPTLRRTVKLVLDAALAGAAWVLSERFLSGVGEITWHLWGWVALAMAANLGFHLTRQHYRFIGFKDALRIGAAVLTLCLAAIVLVLLFPRPGTPFNKLDTIITASLTTGGAWGLLRAAARVRHDQVAVEAIPQVGRLIHRTLIVGAGRAGLLVAQELNRHPELGCRIVGFVDDAFEKQGIHIQGIPVLGPSRLLAHLIAEHGITQVVFAIPSAAGSAIRHVSDTVRATGAELKTVPGIYDLLGPKTWKPVLRDVSIEDLLRREPVELNLSSLNLVLEDSVVLITGGGGSIGGELARQVAAFRPARVVLLGRGENSLWETERSLRSLFPNQGLSLELCDIRNPIRLQQVFDRWKPQVVFHAAAHKHVPYLEAHPEEGVDNNIFGTLNVINAAMAVHTHTFVNISTDKAVNPTNVLGASKRIAESLVVRAARRAPKGTRYVSVRFGNVLGSRGSVIPIFQEQIRTGGPITVTHPDMTRFFMTVPEASQLVLQAGILGDTAEVYVLDMGDPIKIVDLATDMARLSGLVPGQDIEVQFSGIRPGEKLFEELFTQQEESRTGVHPKVFNANPEALEDALLDEGMAALRLSILEGDGRRQAQILHWLKRLVPTYAPALNGLGRYSEEARDRRVSGAHPIYVPGGPQA